jgi:multiple sugar transport system substrate-binding protein
VGRKQTLFLWVIVVALVSSACSEPDSTQPISAFPDGDVKITVWNDAEDTMNAYFKDTIIPEYEKLHPNVTVDYQIYSTPDIVGKILTAVASQTAPTVMDVPGALLPTLYEKDVLIPAEDKFFPDGGLQGLRDAYLPGSIEEQQHAGDLYALPYQENSLSLYMNNRMFEEAGLDPEKDAPETWDDLRRLSDILTKRDSQGRIVQKGFDFRLEVGDHWIFFIFEQLVYQAGGEVLDPDGAPVFNDAYGVEAMQTWLKATTAPEITINTGANPYLDFFQEKDAMTYGGPNAGAVGELVNPDMKGNWTAAPMPQLDPEHPVTIRYHFDFVVSDDASPEEAWVGWDFVNFALSDPEPWFKKTLLLQPRNELVESASAQNIRGMDVFLHDLEISRPLSQSPHSGELQAAIARAVQRIVLEGADIQESLDDAAQDYVRATE